MTEDEMYNSKEFDEEYDKGPDEINYLPVTFYNTVWNEDGTISN